MSSSGHSWWVFLVAAVLVALPVVLLLMVTWPAADPPDTGSVNLARAAPAVGVVLAVLLGGALALLFLALAEVARGGAPSLETSWGGFGGGLGGWHLSPALTYLLAALFLGGLFGVLTVRVVDSSAFQAWAGVESREEPTEGNGDHGSGPAETQGGPRETGESEPGATPVRAPEGEG